MIFTIILCFVLNISIVNTATCPTGWETAEFMSKCYKLITTGMRYVDAEDYCHAQGSSGHLVSIHSAFELQVVGDIVARIGGSDILFWIGMDNLRSGNAYNYNWIDGTAVDYTNWFPGDSGYPYPQPSHVDSEPCVCMWGPTRTVPNVHDQLKWFTYDCGACQLTLSFMCQLNSTTNPPY